MALVLARLRLALQIGGISRTGLATFVAGWALAVLGGLAGGYAVAWLEATRSAVGDLFVLLMFVLVFAAWAIGPVAAPVPSSNLIDPGVLEQYPLSRSQQVLGLLLGGVISPAAAGTFLFAAGGVAAVGVDLAGRVAAVGGAILFTVLCVAVSYALRALLAQALADRRGRDAAIIVSTVLLVGMYVLGHTVAPLLAAAESAAQLVVIVLSWTPPGAAGALAYVLGAGDLLGGLARTGIVLAAIAAALLVWAIALHRRLAGGSARAVATPHRASARELALVPPVLHGVRLGAGATLGAASQQLRYLFFRAPKAVQFVVMGPVVGIMFGGTQVHTAGLPFAAAIVAVAMGASGLLNLFGYDGRGVETTVQTGASLAAVLRGKLIATSVYLVPAVVAITVGLGIAAGVLDQIPVALLAAAAALLLAYAVGAAASVWNPYDQEAPQGDRSTLSARLLGAFALSFGVVYGVGWLSSWASPVVSVEAVLLVALALAVAAAVLAVRVGGSWLDSHPERLLAAFTPR